MQTVPPRPDAPSKPILCAVHAPAEDAPGASPVALALSRRAVTLAEARGARLSLVDAYDAPSELLDALPVPSGESVESREERHRRAMQDLLARLPAGVEAHVAEGPPAEVILAHAEALDAGLILIGTPDHSTLSRAVGGSVFEDLLRRSERPLRVEPVPEVSELEAHLPVQASPKCSARRGAPGLDGYPAQVSPADLGGPDAR